jgi:hypothetical protein
VLHFGRIFQYGILISVCCTFLLPPAAQGMKPVSEYGYNECELIAKDFQNEYGGNLIFLAPKSWDTGAWIIDDYSGHYVNLKYISGNGKSFYFDYGNQRIFENITELQEWYSHEYSGYDVQVFNLNSGERPPYSMIFHY